MREWAGLRSNKLINLLLNLNMPLKLSTVAFLAASWAAAGWYIFWPTMKGLFWLLP